MLEPTTIIKRPIVSEKATWQATYEAKSGPRKGQTLNRYTFEVDNRARKCEIKAAIEKIYNVKVSAVRTIVRKGESKPTRFGPRQEPTIKRALVDLPADQKIDLFA